jgi:hypothetical protein
MATTTVTSPLFWELQPPDDQRLGGEIDGRKYTRVYCASNEGHRGAERSIGNLAIEISPSGVKDFTWTWMSDILISQRVLDLFATHHVTGFETRPVEVHYPKGAKVEPPDLFDLVVTGWGGLAAAAAGVKVAEYCRDCGRKIFSIAEPSHLIDAGAWDGSDLFIVWPLPRYRFASDRLANILRREKVTGLKLIHASDIRTERGTEVIPGQLSSHMPAERARELSEHFGID